MEATRRPVIVTDHALNRAVRRRHFATEDLTRDELSAAIAAEVRAGFAAGRVGKKLPGWAIRFRDRNAKLRGAQRAVWNAGETLCWVVVREDGRDIVQTSMQRVVAA